MAMSCNDYRLTRRRMLAASGASILGMSVQQLLAAQGTPVDIGGYFHPSPEACAKAMRPSATFNAIIDVM